MERPAVIRAIAEARDHGDLSENAEYHAARERQSFIEGRLSELEDKISRADVIDVAKLSGKQVKFGATVTLVDEDTDEKTAYQIVGQDEADIKTKRLSITSPLARALIGKQVGDSVEVSTPGGSKVYEIVQGPVQVAACDFATRRGSTAEARNAGRLNGYDLCLIPHRLIGPPSRAYSFRVCPGRRSRGPGIHYRRCSGSNSRALPSAARE